MYHEVNIGEKKKDLKRQIQKSFILSVAQFEQQMKYLAEHNFHTISLYDVIKALLKKSFQGLPFNPVVITFDDGYRGNYQYAFPILKQYGFQATFFVIVNRIGKSNMMDYDQLNELLQAGMSVQSHSMNHHLLGEMPDSEMLLDLEASKRIIEENLKTHVNFISLPLGSYNSKYPIYAQKAGYIGGCTSNIGYIEPDTNPFLLNRISITDRYDIKTFSLFTSGQERKLVRLRTRRTIRNGIKFLCGEKNLNKLYNLIYGVNE